MVNVDGDAPQDAPGALEQVRELLNSWLIPNDTREPTDRFVEYATRHRLPHAARADVRRLRDDLRAAVERAPDADRRLTGWLRHADVQVVVRDGGLAFRHATGPVA